MENDLHAPSPVNYDSSRSPLDVKQEHELVEAFAFLASTADDPRKVIAVAVEPTTAESLVVRIAANHGSLTNVSTGLQRLADILVRTARQDSVVIREDTDVFFREAVGLHQNRILGRLRSDHAVLKGYNRRKGRLRPKLIPQLHSTMSMSRVEQSIPTAVNTPEYEVLRATVDSMHAHFLLLESFPIQKVRSRAGAEEILMILRACHEIHSQRILPLILDQIPSLVPDSKVKIIKTIAKLSRYWTVSKFLMKFSKDCHLLRNVKIRTAQYRGRIPSIPALDPVTSQIVDRLCNEKGWEKRLSRRVQTAAQVQAFILKETALDRPVHAEIQLLWYYETTRCEKRPRIIGSSKKACFLCNLFFNIHGVYTIPATHGRLYTKWGLPSLRDSVAQPPDIRTVLKQFMDAVDQNLQDELRSPRKVAIAPWESTIFPSAACSYTNRSNSKSSSPAENALPSSLAEMDIASVKSDQQGQPGDTTMMKSVSLTGSNSTSSVCGDTEMESLSSSLSRSPEPAVIAVAPQEHLNYRHEQLAQGSVIWQHMHAKAPAFGVGTPRMQIILLYDDRATIASSAVPTKENKDCMKDYWIEAEWSRQASVDVADFKLAVDVAGLRSGLEAVFGFEDNTWPRRISLLHGGDVVKLTFHCNNTDITP